MCPICYATKLHVRNDVTTIYTDQSVNRTLPSTGTNKTQFDFDTVDWDSFNRYLQVLCFGCPSLYRFLDVRRSLGQSTPGILKIYTNFIIHMLTAFICLH